MSSEPSALLLLGEEEVSEPVSSAWAIPDPLAKAAPTPKVIAPAPSQAYAWARCGLARRAPALRFVVALARLCDRCPPAIELLLPCISAVHRGAERCKKDDQLAEDSAAHAVDSSCNDRK